jgi:outer membrane protein TolC
MKEKATLPKILFIALIACFAGAAFSGCAVSTQPVIPSVFGDGIENDLDALYQNQEPVNGPISMEEAIDRALKYNLNYRLKLLEEALEKYDLDAARFDLLPSLATMAGYTSRSNTNASSSESVLTHSQSLEPSTSQDRDLLTADLSMTWNILDFGVSYFKARQQANRKLAAAEKRRKAVQQLVHQVRRAYWLAAGTQSLSESLTRLLADAEEALAKAESVKNERLRQPLEMLRYQENLMEIVGSLKRIRDELGLALPRLALLMNLPPGTSFDVVIPEEFKVPVIHQTVREMEKTALLNQPDLYEAEYEVRISADETRKAMARLLPGIELNLDARYDSNSYLVNESWTSGGARITWNMMNLLSAPSRLRAARTREEITRSKLLAISMATLAQVHISRLEYNASLNQFHSIRSIRTLKEEINRQILLAGENRTVSSLEKIRSSTAYLISRLQEYKAFADLQGAYGKVRMTLGVDPPEAAVSAGDTGTGPGEDQAVKKQ